MRHIHILARKDLLNLVTHDCLIQSLGAAVLNIDLLLVEDAPGPGHLPKSIF